MIKKITNGLKFSVKGCSRWGFSPKIFPRAPKDIIWGPPAHPLKQRHCLGNPPGPPSNGGKF